MSTVFLIIAILFALLWWKERPSVRPLDPNAQPRAVTPRGDLAADEKNSIDIFRSVSPSVVYITSVEMRRNFFTLDVYAIPKGSGSGFVWDSDGRIVTNYHVIVNANQVEVTLADGSEWKAVLIGFAPEKDLAVLKIDAPADRLKPIQVGASDNLLVGQKVYAIGNPFGLDQTMTSGIVSAIGREIQSVTGQAIQGVIQTDAAINPGNSGGPLIDSSGRLIGVNTAIYSPSGASAGIGFAVPVETVNRVVPDLIKHGRVIRPGIGVSVVHDRIARRMGINGVVILSVQPGGSAAKAGLMGVRRAGDDVDIGDIIVSVNDKAVDSFSDFRNELERYKVGEMVSLGIQRDGMSKKISVKLEESAE